MNSAESVPTEARGETSSLDRLEQIVEAALHRIQQLTAENARLRVQLADREERIAIARQRIESLAERLPRG